MRGRFDLLPPYILAAAILGTLPICLAAQPGQARFEKPAILDSFQSGSERLDSARTDSTVHPRRSKRFSNQQILLMILGLYVLALAVTISVFRWQRRQENTHEKEAEYERVIRRLKAADIAKERLIAELEAKNAELERFTYTVSHDLKTPLVTIQGFLSFIRRDARSGNLERLDEDIGRINGAVGRMRGLLEELLDLSRIGRVMNAPQRVPLGELVDEASELLAGTLSKRQAEIRVLDDLPIVVGDRARLFQVVQNLLENAIKYSDGAPLIEIGVDKSTAGPESTDRERAVGGSTDQPVVFVRDHGIGIEPKHLEDVFGLFRQLDPGYDGTGIGLALVKRIIELHQGQIWVESDGPGRGSTFFFSLPEAAGQSEVDALT